MGNFGKFNPGGGNMQQLLKQAQKMQEQMRQAQQEIEETTVTGSAGGNLVTVTMDGKKKITALNIKPEACDPDDIEMLEDLIIAACNDAYDQVSEIEEEKLGGFGGMMR